MTEYVPLEFKPGEVFLLPVIVLNVPPAFLMVVLHDGPTVEPCFRVGASSREVFGYTAANKLCGIPGKGRVVWYGNLL